MGLIGHGNIGKRIDKIASAFGMKVDYVDSKSSSQDLEYLLRQADIICVCASLTDKTRNLLNADRIAMIRRDSYIVNVARGQIIDQAALFEALQDKLIAGAGLDVFTDEPLTGKVNQAIIEIAKLPNVVATPHIGTATHEAHDRLSLEIINDIQSCLSGKPINVVN